MSKVSNEEHERRILALETKVHTLLLLSTLDSGISEIVKKRIDALDDEVFGENTNEDRI